MSCALICFVKRKRCPPKNKPGALQQSLHKGHLEFHAGQTYNEFLTQTKNEGTLLVEKEKFERFVKDYKDLKLASYGNNAASAAFFEEPIEA